MAQQRYHVLERIDAGGMAEVFKANASSLKGYEKLVAIKRILPNLTKDERFVRMFLDEAKVSLHLSHTNCVQVFDLGRADQTYFIVMEYVDGVNLKYVIEKYREKRKSIPVEHATYIAIEICKGLAHAHEKRDEKGNHLGIVHRDVSPPNVLISREGEVKLTDFGLAKAKGQVEQTDPGVVKGKFGYLSPEAAQGDEVDLRTDIFALGILLWEMLSGQRLFLGKTDLETLQLVRKNKYIPLSQFRNDVPPALENIIRKLLANKKKRYTNVRDATRDLAIFLFSHGIPVTSFDISAMTAKVGARRKTVAATNKDRAVEAAVQQAVNRIVSLEEVDDLDAHLAEVYQNLPDAGADLIQSGGSEDPRLWADVGFDDVHLKGDVRESKPETWAQPNKLNPDIYAELDDEPELYDPTIPIQISPPDPYDGPVIAKVEPVARQKVKAKTQNYGAMNIRPAPSIAPPQMHSTGLPGAMRPAPSVDMDRTVDVNIGKEGGLPLGLIGAICALILSVLAVLYVVFIR